MAPRGTFCVLVVLYVCVCVVIPIILDVGLMDVPAGVTHEEGHTGFLNLPSAVLALIFLARRIQPFLSHYHLFPFPSAVAQVAQK